MNKSFNPHWVGNDCVRDYKIGNITLKNVPDSLVLRHTSMDYRSHILTVGVVDEFMDNVEIEIDFDRKMFRFPNG